MVRIQDHYVPIDIMVLDMGEEEDVPIILGRPFLNTINAITMLDMDKSTSNSLDKRYIAISIVIQLMNIQKRSAPREDADHLNARRINSQRMMK